MPQSVAIEPRERTSSRPRSAEPGVSIIVPTYNRATLLKETLENLASLDYRNYEIVVVDDCSSDQTPEVIGEFAQQFPRLVHTRHQVNSGGFVSWATAASLATKDYILILSDDDLLRPNTLGMFAEKLSECDYDIVYCDLTVIDKNGRDATLWKYRSYPTSESLINHLLVAGCNVIPEVVLIRRSLYESVHTEYAVMRFITPFYLAGLNYLKLGHIPHPLYKYRVHSQSVFASISGLVRRNKGVANHMCAAAFKYSLRGVFKNPDTAEGALATAERLLKFAKLLVLHGDQCIEGKYYTGVQYSAEDKLFGNLLEAAYHWLVLARRYNAESGEIAELISHCRRNLGEDYNALSHNVLPAIFRSLPWFCFRPSENSTSFVPLDMLTLGSAPAWLSFTHIPLWNDSKLKVTAVNRNVQSSSEADKVLDHAIVHVVNVFDSDTAVKAADLLHQRELYGIHLVTVGCDLPATHPFRTTVKLSELASLSLQSYLRELTITTTDPRWGIDGK